MISTQTKAAARRADRSNAWSDSLSRSAQLPAEEQVALIRKAQAGDKAARDKVITTNLRLVCKQVHCFVTERDDEYESLVSEGTMGMMHALDKFDTERGVNFSTYAVSWIRCYIQDYRARNSSSVTIPKDRVKTTAKVMATANRLADEGVARVSNEMIAEACGERVATVTDIMRYTPKTVRFASYNEDSGASYAGIDEGSLADDRDESHAIEQEDFQSKLHAAIKQLPVRQQAILRARFGLDTDEEMSLEEVGKTMNLTRERVRQLQNEALAALRSVMRVDEMQLAI